MESGLRPLFSPVQANGRERSNVYREYAPSPALYSYIACFWSSEPALDLSESCASEPQRSPGIDRVVPDGCTDLIFEQDTAGGRYRIRFSGVFDYSFAIVYDRQRPIRKLGVRFFPGGACSFIRDPLSSLTNSHAELESLWPQAAEALGALLPEAESAGAAVSLLDRWLSSQLGRHGAVSDSMMANLLHGVLAAEGRLSVVELARSETVSARHMNRKFAHWIGISPKRFSEIVRFQALLNRLRRDPGLPEWPMLALERGFFDQSHMIREFKRFYGESPIVAAREFGCLSDLSNPPGLPPGYTGKERIVGKPLTDPN